MAFFVAFYSYKGGVGRTLALANAAYSLAARGKRVVLVDMDLEAPGLQAYKEFAVRGKTPKGFVEYAAHYRQTGKCPALKGYVHLCKESPGTGKLWLMPAGAIGGTYQKQLADLPWRKLHPQKGTLPFLETFKIALTEEIQPDYVLIDSRTGLSDAGGLSTHQLADLVVLVFNLTSSCLEGSVRAYRSFVSGTSKARFLQLVASPVPPLAPVADSIVERRLAYAREHMSLGVAYGRTILRIEYNPAMALSEELAVHQPEVFPAAERYEMLREAIQRANQEEVFSILEHIREMPSSGRLEEGLLLLHSFTEEHPNNAEGYFELGNLLFEAGRIEGAIPAFQKARDLAPSLPPVHRRLGEALAVAGHPREAIIALERAEELGEKSQELYAAFARAYADQGENTQAIEARRKAMTHVLQERRLDTQLPSAQDPKVLRQEFVEILSRLPPYAGFNAEAFWDTVMGSLSLKVEEKLAIFNQVLGGKLRPQQIVALLKILREEREKWLETVGPSAPEFMQRVAEHFVDPTNAEGLLELRQGDRTDAAAVLFAFATGKISPEQQIPILTETLQHDPQNVNLLLLLASVLHQQAQRPSPVEEEARRQLLLDACFRYEEALRYKPDKHEALFNWGNALRELAELVEKQDKPQLLLDAFLKYEEALRHKPNEHNCLNNWGNVLLALADLSEQQDKQRFLLDACLKYEEAIRHKPDTHEALNNWGNALLQLADLAEGQDKRQLLLDSCLKYEEALRHKPDKHEALNNWGIALVQLADLAERQDKRQLLLDSCLKYEEALRHKSDKHEALNNWATALLKLCYVTDDAQQRDVLLRDAAEKARLANEIQPGSTDYNLACAMSLLGEFGEAARLITADLERRPYKAGQALRDLDFAPLWEARPDLRESIASSLERAPFPPTG